MGGGREASSWSGILYLFFNKCHIARITDMLWFSFVGQFAVFGTGNTNVASVVEDEKAKDAS